ncbi:MAG: DUF2490 domain-containing protein [Bacteroidales bacterium]|nr:DUF2490 domain-containing protein [Candidatus Cacconaster merdequi]
MKRTLSLRCGFSLFFLAFGFLASAQSETDFGTWSSIQVNKSISDCYAFLRAEHRSFQNVSSTEAWFIATGGGYKFAPWINADLSYEFWKLPSAGNTALHKGVLCVTGTLRRDNLAVILREKYELAFNASSKALSHTSRTRLRTQYSFQQAPVTPYLMYEYFVCAGTGWQRSLHYMGAEIRIAPHNMIDIFYMYHLYDSSPSVKSCNLLGIGYYLSF